MSSWRKQKNPLSPSTSRDDLVRSGAETGVALHGTHERVRHLVADARRHVAGVAHDQEQQLEVAVVLADERTEHLVEPVAGLVHDHHGHYGRGDRSSGFHEGFRLAARTAETGHPAFAFRRSVQTTGQA